jgi:glycosyltransferase involved in cell wall biosynthesis
MMSSYENGQQISSSKKLVSIIAPVYNEEAVIEEFIARLINAVAQIGKNYVFEFILINDGSNDNSLELMKKCALQEKRIRVIELRRNYGQAPALQAGVDAAKGEIFVTMDSDLQHFPEEVPAFINKLEEGNDMVCGWRYDRQEGLLRRWPSRIANMLIRKISKVDLHDFGTTFRAYRSELAQDIEIYGEFHRFIPVLGHLAGAKIVELPIRNVARNKGKSNYGISRTIGVFLDLFLLFFMVKYIDRPIRLFGKISLFCFAVGAIIIVSLIIYAYSTGIGAFQQHIGWFMLANMLLLASLQLILVGILAEILIRIHFSVGGRKTYHIRREWSDNGESRK